jgi:Bacterial Ig-like domain
MKRVLLALGLLAAVLSVPTQSNARKDVEPKLATPPIVHRPFVFERYPIDLSDFNSAATDADGPFDFTDASLRPFDHSFGDERGGSLSLEPNHTFYGMDTNTDVYAGISGAIYDIRPNPDGECDSEVFISPDSPVFPGSWVLYIDHIRPTEELISAIADGPISVTPDTIIGKVGIQGDCATGKGWIEIGVFKDRPDTAAYVGQFCPVLFMPTGARAPRMPTLPALNVTSRAHPTVADTTPPRIVSRTPAIAGRGVSASAKITMTFNERVKKTTNSEWRVSIIGINPQNVWNIPGTSSAIRISPNGKTVTINLARASTPITLTNGQMYAVKIDQGTFLDMSGNMFAGIMEAGDWYFSVGPSTVLPGRRTYTANRTTISNQIKNVMLKYNRIVGPTSGFTFPSDQTDSSLAGCSISKFNLQVVG